MASLASPSPLDINYAKLIEWMVRYHHEVHTHLIRVPYANTYHTSIHSIQVDRKQLPTDFTKRLSTVQSKASSLNSSLPPHLLNQLNPNNNNSDTTPAVDYLYCKKVLEKLTEDSYNNKRTLLGNLKGTSGEWERVITSYEHGLLHIAEASLALARNGEYEIPYLKKQATKYQQQMADLEKKRADCIKSAGSAAVAHHQLCESLGGIVPGPMSKLPPQIEKLRVALPDEMTKALEKVDAQSVGDAANYYTSFTSSSSPSCLLPILDEVRQKSTRAPQSFTLFNIEHAVLGNTTTEEMDVNSLSTTTTAAPAHGGGCIAWDFDITSSSSPVQISNHTDTNDNDTTINWDIDMSGGGVEVGEESEERTEFTITTIDGGTESSSNSGSSILKDARVARLIVDEAYRAKVLDDLHELKAFLRQRHQELANDSIIGNISSRSAIGNDNMTAATVAELLNAVSASIDALTKESLQRLILLSTSEKYTERLAGRIRQSAGQEAKFLRGAEEAEAKRAEVQRTLMAETKRLNELVEKTRGLKELVQVGLGSKLGRKVNVQGEINKFI
jgi:hypothetical protein